MAVAGPEAGSTFGSKWWQSQPRWLKRDPRQAGRQGSPQRPPPLTHAHSHPLNTHYFPIHTRRHRVLHPLAPSPLAVPPLTHAHKSPPPPPHSSPLPVSHQAHLASCRSPLARCRTPLPRARAVLVWCDVPSCCCAGCSAPGCAASLMAASFACICASARVMVLSLELNSRSCTWYGGGGGHGLPKRDQAHTLRKTGMLAQQHWLQPVEPVEQRFAPSIAQAGGQAGRRAGRQAGGQAGRRAGRPA